MEPEKDLKIHELESRIEYYQREINSLKARKDPMVGVLLNELCEELNIVLHDDYLNPDKLSKNIEKQLKNIKSNLKMFLLDRGYSIICPELNFEDVNHETMEVKFVTETEDKFLDGKVRNVIRFGILDNEGKAVVKAYVDIYKYIEPKPVENPEDEPKNSKKPSPFKTFLNLFNFKNLLFIGFCLISSLLVAVNFFNAYVVESQTINMFILEFLTFYIFANELDVVANKSRNRFVVESISLAVPLVFGIVVGCIRADYYLIYGTACMLVIALIPYLLKLFLVNGSVKLSKISFHLLENSILCYCFIASFFGMNILAGFLSGLDLSLVSGIFMFITIVLFVIAILTVCYKLFSKNKVAVNCMLAMCIFSYVASFAVIGYNLVVMILNLSIIAIIISFIIFNKFKKEEK